MGFQQGLSGLNISSKSLEVIGNNVANANTYGYKSARAEFADMYAASLGGAGNNGIGIGARIANVAQQFTQGNVSTTANNLDLAINGDGFFTTRAGVTGQTYYTRNGSFTVDSDRYVTDQQGNKLLVYPVDGSGAVVATGIDAWHLFYMGVVKLESPVYARIALQKIHDPNFLAASWGDLWLVS